MKASKIMTKSVGFCQAPDTLADALKIMWEKDCGIVPVVDAESKVIGTVTDRDAAAAVFLQNKTAAEIEVGEIIEGEAHVCREKDSVEDVLKKMRKKQVKRIPIVDESEKLVGIISVTDVLLAADKEKSLKKKLLKTLAAIAKPRPIVLEAIES